MINAINLMYFFICANNTSFLAYCRKAILIYNIFTDYSIKFKNFSIAILKEYFKYFLIRCSKIAINLNYTSPKLCENRGFEAGYFLAGASNLNKFRRL